MQVLNHNSTHFVGTLSALSRGAFASQHRSVKAAQSQAAWLRKHDSQHRRGGCEVWTREQIEAARAAVSA